MDKRERLLKKLLDEQQPDGSFGRFHTMNSKLKLKISTTQSVAWLMYENLITRNNDICNKTHQVWRHFLYCSFIISRKENIQGSQTTVKTALLSH